MSYLPPLDRIQINCPRFIDFTFTYGRIKVQSFGDFMIEKWLRLSIFDPRVVVSLSPE